MHLKKPTTSLQRAMKQHKSLLEKLKIKTLIFALKKLICKDFSRKSLESCVSLKKKCVKKRQSKMDGSTRSSTYSWSILKKSSVSESKSKNRGLVMISKKNNCFIKLRRDNRVCWKCRSRSQKSWWLMIAFTRLTLVSIKLANRSQNRLTSLSIIMKSCAKLESLQGLCASRWAYSIRLS